MNLGILKFGILLLLTALTNPLICAAQSPASAVIQDPKIERLLAEKRKINSSITITDKYKIQLFSGENETAKKTLVDFRKENKNLDATIVFNTPSYKVWIGNFKSRIEAEKALFDLKKRYPNAFLVKPNK
ncbi:MAG: SPOR domain-containing protein [Flavobacterium sp.]|jgi:hypothetical protein|nr:SPOR domain-containing protein [Flavobacterium sp.]